jgi:hypothetical protein
MEEKTDNKKRRGRKKKAIMKRKRGLLPDALGLKGT